MVAFVLALSIGDKRKIGLAWSLAFCVTGGLFIGIIAMVLSPSKKSDKAYLPNTQTDLKNISAIVLFAIGAFFLYASCKGYFIDNISYQHNYDNDLYSQLQKSQQEISQNESLYSLSISITSILLACYITWPPVLKGNQDDYILKSKNSVKN